MPEQTAPPVTAPPAPDLKAMIGEAVSTALSAQEERRAAAQARADQEAEQQRRVYEARQQQAVANQDPLRAVIREKVGGDLDAIRFIAENAKDASAFYAIHPEAREFAGDIEAKITEAHGRGIPIDRESTWQWYQGANLPKFVERANLSAADKIAAAQNATAATGAGPRAAQQPDWAAMSQEERSRLLAGVSF